MRWPDRALRASATDHSARRKFKHRSRNTRDPPPPSCPLRATPSIRPQPPARTDPRPHSAAFPPREHTAPAPRPPSDRIFAPHRPSAASPSSAAPPCAAGGARRPDGSDPAAVRPSAPSTSAIAAGSWIAASTRRGPAHCGQTISECELFYWRDGGREVDFVATRKGKATAIEVKSGRRRDHLPGIAAMAE
ncbi:MAG: hypothetical protein ACK52I_17310, partial [Pseudomonadota bacterium]